MGKETYQGPLERVDECCWRIPRSYKQGMRVDGLIFTSEEMLEQLKKDGEVSEDDEGAGLKKMQASVDKTIAKVDEIVAKKEAEILEV